MKRGFIIGLAVALAVGTISSVYGATSYSDVSKTNWAYEAVNAMSDKVIIKGYPNGSFMPNNTVTYGEFIKMALIAGTGQDLGNAKFGHWASDYYSKALEINYFTAHDIGKSQLSSQITRGDMALIISSILGDVKIENYDEIQQGITDIDYKTKHEYDITKAYFTGILTGYTDNTFKPEKTLTRAESATVIYRLVDESKRALPEGEKEPSGTEYKLVDTAAYFDKSPEAIAKVKSTNTGDFTEKAELYSDPSKFDIEINKEWTAQWGSSFNHKLNGFIYLVKDGELVSYCDTTPRYNSAGDFLFFYGSMTGEGGFNIREADYIVCVSANVNTNIATKIVANPLKK